MTHLNLIDSHKLHYHPQIVSRYLESAESRFNIFPIYVEVSPVGHCNHRCTFCALDYLEYKKRELDIRVLKLCLRNMGSNGVKSVMFAGEGEPMLHSRFTEGVVEAKGAGLDVAITTNGTRLDDEFVREGLGKCSWIKVSVNGGTAGDYARVHSVSYKEFDRVVGNVSRLVEERKREKYDTTIGVQCVLLPDNVGSVRSLVELCHKIGVDYIVIKPYSKHLMSKHKLYDKIDYSKYYGMLADLEEFGTPEFKVLVRMDTIKYWDTQSRVYKKCLSVPYFWAYVDSLGDVYACSCFLGKTNWILGNIHNQGFKSIWLGDKRRRLIERMENMDVTKCRVNCRMDKCNRYLDSLINPPKHVNFI